MGSSSNGLTAEQAEELLKEVGPNTVAAGGRKSLVMDLLHRCKNPLVIQLLVMCALFYWAADDPASASIVGAMVFLSVFLSYFQETRSSRAVEKLQKMVKTTVTVVRDGKETDIQLEEVVPGDVVVLAAGSLIPADLRILTAKDFFVSQSALTGESMPVEKSGRQQPARGPRPVRVHERVLHGEQCAERLGPGARDHDRRKHLFRLARREDAFEARPNELRQGHLAVHLAHDPVHDRDGALRLRGRRDPGPQLARGDALRPRDRGGADPGDAADDHDGVPLEGRPHDVPQEGHREAPSRDPELRRDGRPLHRQDGHPDAGPRRPRALRRRDQPRERGRPALRVHEQLSTRRACATCSTARSSPTPTSTWSATAGRSTRSPSTSSGGGCRW